MFSYSLTWRKMESVSDTMFSLTTHLQIYQTSSWEGFNLQHCSWKGDGVGSEHCELRIRYCQLVAKVCIETDGKWLFMKCSDSSFRRIDRVNQSRESTDEKWFSLYFVTRLENNLGERVRKIFKTQFDISLEQNSSKRNGSSSFQAVLVVAFIVKIIIAILEILSEKY